MEKKGLTKVGLIFIMVLFMVSLGVLIINFLFDNPVVSIFDKSLKTQMETYQRELNSTVIALAAEDSTVKAEDVTAITFTAIKKYLPSFKKQDYGVFEIVNGKVVLVPKK